MIPKGFQVSASKVLEPLETFRSNSTFQKPRFSIRKFQGFFFLFEIFLLLQWKTSFFLNPKISNIKKNKQRQVVMHFFFEKFSSSKSTNYKVGCDNDSSTLLVRNSFWELFSLWEKMPKLRSVGNKNGAIQIFLATYCWWKKSWTTWDVQNLANNGIKYQPQLVSRISFINSTIKRWECASFYIHQTVQLEIFFGKIVKAKPEKAL